MMRVIKTLYRRLWLAGRAIRIFAGLTSVCPSASAGAKLAIRSLALCAQELTGSAKRHWARIELRIGGETRSVLISGISELAVAHEVLVGEEYAVTLPTDPRTIIDLGSNVGLSVLFFQSRFREAETHGFEADPETFRVLRANTRQVPRVKVTNAAVAGARERRVFYRHRASWTSSLAAGGNDQRIELTTITLSDALDLAGWPSVDLLKIDVEGAELDILSDAQALSRCQAVIGEFHSVQAGVSREQFFKLFDSFDVEILRAAPAVGRCSFMAQSKRPNDSFSPADRSVASQ